MWQPMTSSLMSKATDTRAFAMTTGQDLSQCALEVRRSGFQLRTSKIEGRIAVKE
jgi:hypothetical protein